MSKYIEIPIYDTIPFHNHPYKVLDDIDLVNLLRSIEENGLYQPITVRKLNNKYEIISGHRRVKVFELLGKTHITAEILDLSDEEATIRMVESNFARSKILPSEKAFSYKMLLDARKRQGKKSLVSGRSNEEVSEIVKESVSQIKRYIRLTELNPLLLSLVDNGRIALRPAVELSYLSTANQNALSYIIEKYDSTPSYSQAVQMKKAEINGLLDSEMLFEIMSVQKPNQKERISLNIETIHEYIPENLTPLQAQKYILNALEFYRRNFGSSGSDVN